MASRESILRITVGPRRPAAGRGHARLSSLAASSRRRGCGAPPRLIPDDGGLNVEALSWDPRRQALLFGLRTPVD